MRWFLKSSVLCITYVFVQDAAGVYFERRNSYCIRAAPYKELN
jgi:hypothetical protein